MVERVVCRKGNIQKPKSATLRAVVQRQNASVLGFYKRKI